MRKKLLALMMCATMVLGTGVTAFAATSASDAKKVYGENAEKFMAEYYPEEEVVKADAYNGSNGTVEYGYLDNADTTLGQYSPVVIFKSNGDTATKNQYYPATAVSAVNFTATEVGGKSLSETASDRITTAITNGSVTAADVYAVEVKVDNSTAKQVVAVKVTGTTGNLGVDSTIATEGFVTNTKRYVKAASVGTLVKGTDKLLKSTDEDGYGKIYASLGYTSIDPSALISAIDSKVFTKDAVAVKVTAYLQGTVATVDLGLEKQNVYNGNAKILYNIDKLQAGTYTFDSDLISRTGFKDAEAVNVFQPTIAATKFDVEAGTLVQDFVKVATVEVGKTITFDNDASYVDGIFVFDKGEAASNNDGVSDSDATTAASDAAASTTTSSPKTGDVAPIAALAVVMMGACGAMVVASKKRA